MPRFLVIIESCGVRLELLQDCLWASNASRHVGTGGQHHRGRRWLPLARTAFPVTPSRHRTGGRQQRQRGVGLACNRSLTRMEGRGNKQGYAACHFLCRVGATSRERLPQLSGPAARLTTRRGDSLRWAMKGEAHVIGVRCRRREQSNLDEHPWQQLIRSIRSTATRCSQH